MSTQSTYEMNNKMFKWMFFFFVVFETKIKEKSKKCDKKKITENKEKKIHWNLMKIESKTIFFIL